MALIVKDRVRETTNTTGTGTLTLIAPVTGFQSFSVIGDGNQTYYSIVDVATGAFEVGIGTYTASGTTLSRQTVLESSNANALVSFGDDGASFIQSAQIRADVDGTPGTDDMPGRLVFSTTADGASAPTERMRIDNAGNTIQQVNTTAPTLTTNQTLNFSLLSNSMLRISVRGSDGVTRTATVALV